LAGFQGEEKRGRGLSWPGPVKTKDKKGPEKLIEERGKNANA